MKWFYINVIFKNQQKSTLFASSNVAQEFFLSLTIFNSGILTFSYPLGITLNLLSTKVPINSVFDLCFFIESISQAINHRLHGERAIFYQQFNT